MEYTHKSGLVATFDYGTVKEAIINDGDPIYIYKDEGLEENNIKMSIEETKWLINKLQALVDAFEEERTEMNDYRMYILVNKDIKISKGKLAGQVGHAVMSYIYYNAVKPLQEGRKVESLDEYMKTQKKIILKCPQWRLEELEAKGGYSVIRDNGLTQLEPNTLTCVNYGIMTPDALPEWVAELKLYN